MTHFSCLKEIEEIENLNTNIYDPAYAGKQWFTFDDLYLYTNSANDQRVRLNFSVVDSLLSDLKPSHMMVIVQVNEYPTTVEKMKLNYNGSYGGEVNFVPDGSQEYCLTLSIYIEDEEISINPFTECKEL